MKHFQVLMLLVGALLPCTIFAQTENWVYTLNGSANYLDEANCLVYGSDGNIYAAGYSYENATDADLTVISLTTSGDTNWIHRYNGPGNGDDWARDIVYGDDGNIYATGGIEYTGALTDFAVISLTTAGDTNWVYHYNGPANSNDIGYSIDFGIDGNIYAAGVCSNQGYYDFTVISLTPAGTANWVYRYSPAPNIYDDVANSIVCGADSNIYVAGYSTIQVTYWVFMVVSLTTAGDTNWIYRYDECINIPEMANSVTYGEDGNIYAAGYSADSTSETDYLVVSLSTAGDTNWTYRYNGPGNSYDMAHSVVYGADGNIYTTGSGSVSQTNLDFTVISLSATGDTNWTYLYAGSGDTLDNGNTILYGADGNIYAAGYTMDSATGHDIAIISLTTTGDTNWTYRYNGEGNDYDRANSLAYGTDGNIYMGGVSSGNGSSRDFTVISLDPAIGVKEEKRNPGNYIPNSTIFAGPLLLPKGKACKVFDITGREVKPEHLQPGIYFIEVDGKCAAKVVKVK